MSRLFPDINNNYVQSFGSTKNTNISENSDITLTGVFSFIERWETQSFPLINYSNPFKSKNVNNSLKEKKKKSKILLDYDDDENISSRLYFRNVFNNNKMYLLKFKTDDVSVKSVFLKPRIFEERDTDKCVQPKSKTIFKNKYNVKAKRLSVLYKYFKLDKKSDRLSIMSSKKPLMKPRRLAPLPPIRKSSISHKKSSIDGSIIYLKENGMKWELYPGIIDLKQIKTIDYKSKSEQQKLLKDLGMESTEQLKNKANFIVRRKKDVFSVTFTLTEITFEDVIENVSQGVQVIDDNAYFEGFSEITDRRVYIPIPKTTFQYIDPMIEVRHRNTAIKLGKLEPRWMYETRMKRINDYKSCRVLDIYKNMQELKVGSSICFEGNNTVYKAKTGSVQCGVDEDEYEKWVCDQQKMDYSSLNKETDEAEQYQSTFPGDIPKWDLVLNGL